MNVFQQAIHDMFAVKDFLEEALIDNTPVPCVCSSLPEGVSFTETGLQQEIEGFALDFMAPVPPCVKVGARLVFRGRTYKIRQLELDSAGTSFKAMLVSLSQGVA